MFIENKEIRNLCFNKLKQLLLRIEQNSLFLHAIIPIKTSHGSCVGKPKASDGSEEHTSWNKFPFQKYDIGVLWRDTLSRG